MKPRALLHNGGCWNNSISALFKSLDILAKRIKIPLDLLICFIKYTLHSSLYLYCPT